MWNSEPEISSLNKRRLFCQSKLFEHLKLFSSCLNINSTFAKWNACLHPQVIQSYRIHNSPRKCLFPQSYFVIVARKRFSLLKTIFAVCFVSILYILYKLHFIIYFECKSFVFIIFRYFKKKELKQKRNGFYNLKSIINLKE